MGRRNRKRERQGGAVGDRASAGATGRPASSRHTPPRPPPRFRPGWHRVLGWLIVVFGVGVAVVNDLEFVGVGLMPGGHNELYLILAIAIAGGGTWFLGLFDPPL